MEQRPKKIIRYICLYITGIQEKHLPPGSKNIRVVEASGPKSALKKLYDDYSARDVKRVRLLYNPIIAQINKDNGYTTNEEQTETIEFG